MEVCLARIYVVLAALLAIAGAAPCYCQNVEEMGRMEEIDGTVTSVDWVGSILVVNDVRLSVPDEAHLYKSNDTITLSDIEIGDQVVVKYIDKPTGDDLVISATVQYNGDLY